MLLYTAVPSAEDAGLGVGLHPPRCGTDWEDEERHAEMEEGGFLFSVSILSGILCVILAVVKFMLGRILTSRALITDGFNSLVGGIMGFSILISAEVFKHNPKVWYLDGTTGVLIGLIILSYGINYLEMLNGWLIPQLRNQGVLDSGWFQQDGAPAHFEITVRDRLNEVFGNRWIRRGSNNNPAPPPWPRRSTDLTTPDNALWGFIKEDLRKRCYSSNDELKHVVRAAFQKVNSQMLQNLSRRTWQRIRLGRDHGGTHPDILDS
ncbi:TM163 protein, partial [Polypterus senegalus]